MKKKRAGIELESLGLSVCVYGFFFLGEGRCSGDSDKVTLENPLVRRGKNVPGKGSSMKELETARRPGGEKWMSEGRMVGDEAGDGMGPDHTGLIHSARGSGCCFERIWKLYAGQWLT